MPDTPANSPDRFEPKSHFFTIPGTFTQLAGQAFGPDTIDEFRLTSKFTFLAEQMAYAICSGTVLIQPQTGSTDKVNLVLRPYEQPVQGVTIKYFVYRGLKKADFFDGNLVKAASIATPSTTTDLINKVNADFAAFYDEEPAPPAFESAFIGCPTTLLPGATYLDDLFFKISTVTGEDENATEDPETAFELPKIGLGHSLGHFVAGECGIEVVLSYGDYRIENDPSEFTFDLTYARAVETKIVLTGITNEFTKKLKREQVFQFLDVAAYFGFHHCDKGLITATANDGSSAPVLRENIYSEILDPFATKNNYYLYIQSDRTRSYNYYGNYLLGEATTNSIMYGIAEDALSAREYGTNGWPLIIESTAQDHADTRNKIYLQLVTDNNVNVLLYGQTAMIDNAIRDHFMNAEGLRISLGPESRPGSLTSIIIISNAALSEGGVKKYVANFGILVYCGKEHEYIIGDEIPQVGSIVNLYAKRNFFDDVFGNVSANSLMRGEEVNYSVIDGARLNLINCLVGGQQFGISASQTLVINDLLEIDNENMPLFSRVTYLTETVDFLNNTSSAKSPINGDLTTSPSMMSASNKKFNLKGAFDYKLKPFSDVGETITGILLSSLNKDLPNTLILGISADENNNLKSLIGDNSLTGSQLFLADIGINIDSGEGIKYSKYLLGITGETDQGELRLFFSDVPIYIYSLDNRFHYSKTYSDNLAISVTNDLIYDHSKA